MKSRFGKFSVVKYVRVGACTDFAQVELRFIP
jgi:hypothetical protein